MATYAWDESMTTGIELIDTQHKELLGKLSELTDALQENKERQIIGDILDFLQFYAQWHFEKEEACMEQYKCPMAENNKRAHAEFVETFTRIYETWQRSGPTPQLAASVSHELQAWLVAHIRHTDSSLYVCVKHA